ncbi:NADP-dependent oxidoreductase [Flavobacterium wongokense]|uniref:NADP-dependent oxidoreductase n=1 Tax=Flavobacterium wongokense TaxID=2910674 RepID=UPI001F357398|nr:NADP-dependent oxidoreductase [Flavobacterium sp. WG47]MCF6132789.1 NADP-dependent oxidoreductase [Flavobacterium sp. WG47]
MKAITLEKFGGVENFKIQNLPMPTISENEVLVKVKAFSVNPVDVKTRVGGSLAKELENDPPIILGWDISGTIEEVGANVTNFKVGDEVFGMVKFGQSAKAYAEYVAAPADHLALKPANITHPQAAASTLAALTAWQALTYFGKLKQNDTILIHAAAGGVGHFAVQIAKHLGANVIGTSSEKNKEFVLSLGANEHIDYRSTKFEDVVSDIDFVLETMGYENFGRSIDVLKPTGTIINLPSGLSDEVKAKAIQKGVNANFFMTVFSDSHDINTIASLLQSNILTPYISHQYSFEEIGAAHTQMESGSTVGKIVVLV